MKFILLCKRQYVNHDLFNDRFWKYWELPIALGALGHQVEVLALSYRDEPEFRCVRLSGAGDVTWSSLNCSLRRPWQLLRYVSVASERIVAFKPDFIVGATDAPYCIIAHWLSQGHGVPFVLEHYDNFFAFSSIKIPFMTGGLRKAVQCASLNVCFSQTMHTYLENMCGDSAVSVLEDAVSEHFRVCPTSVAARNDLGLPLDVPIVGMAGSLNPHNALDLLVQGFSGAKAVVPDLHLAIAGGAASQLSVEDCHSMGRLAHSDIPKFLCALDVVVVPYASSLRADVAFPIRVLEALACKKPFVVSAVGDMPRLLAASPQYMFQPDSAQSLTDALLAQLKDKKVLDYPVRFWDEYAKEFIDLINPIIDKSKSNHSACDSPAAVKR